MRIRWMAVWAGLALGVGVAFAAAAETAGKGTDTDKERLVSTADRGKAGEALIKAVVLSRHGVRSPTEHRKELRQWTQHVWPAWSVKRGELTQRGADLITALWERERKVLAKSGLLPATGCPEKGSVFVYADRDQRTRETARAFEWLGSRVWLFPCCGG